MTRYVAALDQGTTSTRCILFDVAGDVVAIDQKEHRQIYPQPGWVEHDAEEIWANAQAVIRGALAKAAAMPADVAALGVTNQRETVVVWDADTGRPLMNAIVWQDVRTDAMVQAFGAEGGVDRFRERCGLPLATYFSAPKLKWILDHTPGARERAGGGDVLFGTIDSWLIWNLTGEHVTDVTNASRTMLMNLEALDWDDHLLAAFGVPRAMLPRIRASSAIYGEAYGLLAGVAVAGALGDQQAALFGQACFEPGEGKCTYGTGAFLLVNTGAAPARSQSGLITTLAYKIGSEPPVYALEGSIAVTGALVQWLRDNLGLISQAADVEALAASVADTGGCYVVPAFSGLFAPHWRADARGVICGLTGYVTKAHLARAALEATCWQVREVADAIGADRGAPLAVLKADGGMTANRLLMQMQADILGTRVVLPKVAETTALGAAYAAGLAVGFWPDVEALRTNWRQAAEWSPTLAAEAREQRYGEWRKAVARTLDWTS